MRINNNLMAMNTHRQLGAGQANGAKSMEKLSSGFRINRAGDDAAGLSISEKMRGQIRGLNQASRNAQDGISMIQTAEGALQETHAILQRMRELTTQASNDTNVGIDRGAIQKEINDLTSEINRIGNTTEFNTQKVLNGGMTGNNGVKLTEATSAELAGGVAYAGDDTSGQSVSIKVDGRTFSFDELLNTDHSSTTADQMAELIKNVTSGGVKFSDLVEVTNNSGSLEFKALSSGSSSSLEITVGTGNDESAVIFGYADAAAANAVGEVKGDPATIERSGIQMTAGLEATAVSFAKGDNFKITVGSESAVTVTLKEGNYATDGSDPNVAKAAMQDLIKDLNSALQDAGLSGKVTASLSKDNEVQFISETGLDIAVTDGTGTPLSGMGSTTATDVKGNIEQVVGPGVQGSGFTAKFQIGANQGQSMQVNIADMRSAALGITGNAGQAGFTSANGVTNGTNNIGSEAALDVSTHEKASAAITKVNDAIEKVSAQRSALGSFQNRLEHSIKNLDTSSENLQAAESRVRDVDMAKEMMEFTKNNILTQAAQAMLAQANQQPQGVLQLLR